MSKSGRVDSPAGRRAATICVGFESKSNAPHPALKFGGYCTCHGNRGNRGLGGGPQIGIRNCRQQSRLPKVKFNRMFWTALNHICICRIHPLISITSYELSINF